MPDARPTGRYTTGRLVTRARPRLREIVAAVLVVCCWAAVPSAAQQSSAADGLREISGRVIDAESLEPIEGATVRLEPGDGNGTAADVRIATTSSDGVYRFSRLVPTSYRLNVGRIGYFGTIVDVDLRTAAASRLSVGLETSPIALAPIAVVGGRPEPYGRLQPSSTADFGGRRLVDRMRQERYLVSDTRELTHSDVLAAVTLAETDLFRALQRVPGVSTRDDYTATMWTRGATWDQTRVYFDGLPLYNPTHAGWLFAAVNPDAIGAASFHPGYRSAQWGEGSAGVLDLRSRSGRPGGRVHGTAELSQASARLALDGSFPGVNWMIAGRRSYVDLFSTMVEGFLGDDEINVPYDFTDVVGRVDIDLGRGWQLETSSIFEYDHLRGDIPGLLEGNRGRWGNRLARIGIHGPIGPVRAGVTVGGTDFSTLIYDQDDRRNQATTLPSLENAIRHRLLAVQVEPVAADGELGQWTVGAQIMTDSVTYDGPFSLISALAADADSESGTNTPFKYGNSLAHSAVWGEKRWSLGQRVDLLTGLRVEFGDSVANGGAYRFAPRAAVRAVPAEGISLSAAWARNYQYTQDVSPAAGPIGPQLHLSAIWVLASSARAFPAVRTDLTTLGVEHDWGDGWLVAGNLYDRRSTGLKIPNPAPGQVTVGRDPDAEAANQAQGVEITLRRMTGGWTGSLGYAFGTSTLESQPRVEGATVFEFPSSADIEHSFDATGLLRVGEGLRIGGAFTFGSGVPFTELLLDGSSERAPPRLGPPNAGRTPVYASLDLMLEYERRREDWAISGYLQIRNVTNRNNSVTYAGTWNCPPAGPVTGGRTYQEVCAGSTGPTHRFEPGLPRLPLIGLRLAF